MKSSYKNKFHLALLAILFFGFLENSFAQSKGSLQPEALKMSAPFPLDEQSIEAMLNAHGATSAFVRAIRCWVPWIHRSSIGIASIDVFKDPVPPRKVTLETGVKVEQSQFMVGLEQGFYPSNGNKNSAPSWFQGLYPADGQVEAPQKADEDHTLALTIHVNPIDSESDPKITIKINPSGNLTDKQNPITLAILEVKIKRGGAIEPLKVSLECHMQPNPAMNLTVQ